MGAGRGTKPWGYLRIGRGSIHRERCRQHIHHSGKAFRGEGCFDERQVCPISPFLVLVSFSFSISFLLFASRSCAFCLVQSAHGPISPHASFSLARCRFREFLSASFSSSRGRDLGDCSQGDVPYAAAALSLVLHSANPHLPTFRSDVRYFECQVDREGHSRSLCLSLSKFPPSFPPLSFHP